MNIAGFKRKRIREKHEKQMQINKETDQAGIFLENQIKGLLDQGERDGTITKVAKGFIKPQVINIVTNEHKRFQH